MRMICPFVLRVNDLSPPCGPAVGTWEHMGTLRGTRDRPTTPRPAAGQDNKTVTHGVLVCGMRDIFVPQNIDKCVDRGCFMASPPLLWAVCPQHFPSPRVWRTRHAPALVCVEGLFPAPQQKSAISSPLWGWSDCAVSFRYCGSAGQSRPGINLNPSRFSGVSSTIRLACH